MTRTKQARFMSVGLFSLVALLDGLYVFMIRHEPSVAMHAWFVIWPILSFFYFTFVLLAALGIYQRVILGYLLAYAVLLSGMVAVSISYALTFKDQHLLIHLLFECLISLSIFLLIYLAVHQRSDHIKR